MLTNPQTNSSITNTEIAFKSDELILHGSAKTTHAVRATIQRSKASIQELASRYDLNPKTVMKWRKRAFAAGLESPLSARRIYAAKG